MTCLFLKEIFLTSQPSSIATFWAKCQILWLGPYLVVTMADLWPHISKHLPEGTPHLFVTSMERSALEAELPRLGGYSSFVGLGGGQAIDAAKYFAWRLN